MARSPFGKLRANGLQTSFGRINKKQSGFSIVTAIFLLLMLASLGAFMVTFSTAQHAANALDIQGAKAYQAARAGIEWGAYQVLRSGSCAASTTLPALGGMLADFTVTVACVSTAHTDGGSVTMYRLTSTASTGTVSSLGHVERQIEVTLSK